jgi:hypothetical protein
VKIRAAAKKIDRDNYEASIVPFHNALRGWIESRLPKSLTDFVSQGDKLSPALAADLAKANLAIDTAPPKEDGPEGIGFGYAALEFIRFPELPDMVFLNASASIPCGADEAIYAYKFDAARWKRVLDVRRKAMGNAKLKLSEPNASGRRLVLVNWTSQQCWSSWMTTYHTVYRLDWENGIADQLLSETNGFYFNDEGPLFALSPSGLSVEYSSHSVDSSVHHRTVLRRFEFAPAVHRVDPIALQPQDFVEEWLTAPWSEVQSSSLPAVASWHPKIGGGFVLGDYTEVTQCAPSRWLVGIDISHLHDKDLAKPESVFFQLRDLGNHRYRMESITSKRPASCTAEPGKPSEKYPRLSESELRNLR